MSEMGMAMMGTGGATGENRAREAAEKAIRSPLLEDIDLHGARGILVNITAGPDLSIGEFNDVGATVQEFASQEATIVVGTSIDMEMSDELRVTVVAAGLDGSKSKAAAREPARRSAADTSSSDYRKLQQPTVMRQQAADVSAAVLWDARAQQRSWSQLLYGRGGGGTRGGLRRHAPE